MFKSKNKPMFQLWEVDPLTGDLIRFLGFGGTWEYCVVRRNEILADFKARHNPMQVVIIPEQSIMNVMKGLYE